MGGSRSGGEQVKPVDAQQPTWDAHTPAKTVDEVRAYAEAAFRKRSERFLQAEGTTEGDPKIRRDTVVEIEGLGDFLSGPYYVRRAIHSLLPRSGYTVTATLVRTTVEAPAAPPQPVIAQGEPPERVPPKALSDPGWEGEANPDGSAIGGKPAGQGG